MATKTELILGVALVATIIVTAVVALTLNRAVGNVGRIRAVGFNVYADQACATPLTQIDWGMLGPGEMAEYVMYARNGGNVNITLSFNTSDWNPASAEAYLLVAWNYSGKTIRPLEVVAVSTTLTVSQDITGVDNFSYTMNIQATEAKTP